MELLTLQILWWTGVVLWHIGLALFVLGLTEQSSHSDAAKFSSGFIAYGLLVWGAWGLF